MYTNEMYLLSTVQNESRRMRYLMEASSVYRDSSTVYDSRTK